MLADFKSIGHGSIELHESKIVITKSNAAKGKLLDGKTSRTIYLHQLTGITVKKGGLSAGYIHFETSGSEAKKGYKNNVNDDATIVFGMQSNSAALKFKEAVEKQIARVNSPIGESAADEIAKFKDLLDKGVITQDEFDQKKKKLLQ